MHAAVPRAKNHFRTYLGDPSSARSAELGRTMGPSSRTSSRSPGTRNRAHAVCHTQATQTAIKRAKAWASNFPGNMLEQLAVTLQSRTSQVKRSNGLTGSTSLTWKCRRTMRCRRMGTQMALVQLLHLKASGCRLDVRSGLASSRGEECLCRSFALTQKGMIKDSRGSR